MNLGELCDTARSIAGQRPGSAGFWSDEALRVFANEAETEAAIRARLLLDFDTDNDLADTPAPLCKYPVTAGTSSITLNPLVKFVRRLWLGSRVGRLPPIHIRDLDRCAPDWINPVQGDVIVWCPNWRTGKIRFHNAFAATDFVRIQCIRRPIKAMMSRDDVPEIPADYHLGLVNFMLARGYDKLDPDTMSKAKVEKYTGLFEEQFGKRSSAVDETWIQHEHGYDELEGLF